jgi:hypothetical protein
MKFLNKLLGGEAPFQLGSYRTILFWPQIEYLIKNRKLIELRLLCPSGFEWWDYPGFWAAEIRLLGFGFSLEHSDWIENSS